MESQTPTTTAQASTTIAECQELKTSAGEADCQVPTDTDDSTSRFPCVSIRPASLFNTFMNF